VLPHFLDAYQDAQQRKRNKQAYGGKYIGQRPRGNYHVTTDELQGIDRGLKAAREGRFATDEEVEAVLAKYRRK